MRRRLLTLTGTVAAIAALAALLGLTLLGDAAGARCPGCKPPPRKSAWHYQLQGKLRLSAARVYDIDGTDTPASVVSRLHARGRYAVCYISAGTWENWRPDRNRFPESVLGRGNGWPGERWLDVRRRDLLEPIMRDRMAQCAKKGFDAVEPDNVDGYSNTTGFPLTAADQLTYNRLLARTAHRQGLAVGLKNDLEQAAALARQFDFAVVEQCFELRECSGARPFLRRGKAVFEVEYSLPRSRFCAQARRAGISAIGAGPDLDGPTRPCR
jgi:hypothetical protein